MADFGKHGHVTAACSCSLHLHAPSVTNPDLVNAGKGDQDQADLEASTKQNHNSSKGAHKTVLHKPFNEMNIKKLTRAEKGELVDRVLQVIYCIDSRIG